MSIEAGLLAPPLATQPLVARAIKTSTATVCKECIKNSIRESKKREATS